MKICFLGDTAASHLLRWSTYFGRKGHEVHVLTFNTEVFDDYGEVKVHVVKKLFSNPMFIFRILNLVPMIAKTKVLLKRINPDVIHSHSAAGYAWMALFSGFHPFIVTPWGNELLVDIHNSKIEKILTKRALEKADIITCDGENMRKAVMALGIASEKIRFITFGVDIQKFKSNLTKENLKRRLFSSDSKIVISTRTLTPIHNVETFIKAIPIVLKKLPDTKFVIVGDGAQKKYLVELAQSLGIMNAAKFVGRVSENEMVAYLQSADAYVSTSLSESGLAGSTAEAMACEVAVVNTDTGDAGLWIKNGEGGFIIPAENPEILAEKVIYLLQNEEGRMHAGKVNRMVIGERNNYYKEMGKMEDIYEDIYKINNYGR